MRGEVLVVGTSTRAARETLRRWQFMRVSRAMLVVGSATTIDMGSGANEALEKLAVSEVDHLPVVDHGHLRGVVRRSDIPIWLALQTLCSAENAPSRDADRGGR